MTSRIESDFVSSETIRSQPKATPPCGGAPYLKVVGVGQRVARILVEGVDPFGLGRGERVVDGSPGAVAQRDVALGLGVAGGLEERSVDDPGEGPGIGVDEIAALADLETGGAEQLARGGGLAGGEEDAVAGVRAGRGGQAIALGLGDVLGDRATQRAVLGDRDVGQALGAARLGPFLPLVEGTTRLRTAGTRGRSCP